MPGGSSSCCYSVSFPRREIYFALDESDGAGKGGRGLVKYKDRSLIWFVTFPCDEIKRPRELTLEYSYSENNAK